MSLWTQRYTISWPPSLAFFDKRYELLETFSGDHDLFQYRVSEDRIHAKLGDATHFIEFGPDSLEIALLRPDGDVHRLTRAAEIVWAALEPRRVVAISIAFQWLVGLDRSYDDARRDAFEAMVGTLPRVVSADPAFLVDGTIDDPAASFILEFGIVDDAETPGRLAHEYGYMAAEDPDVPSTLWPPESLPKVAFYCDSRWTPQPPSSAASEIDRVMELLMITRGAAEEVVLSLMTKMTPAHDA